MSLQQWAENRWLREHQTSPEEIANLLQIVDRDLKDASEPISPDWRFGIAYNAALRLCTILLYTEGYQAERSLQHYRIIQAMALIFGPEKREDSDYLETCRKKRNIVEYDVVGGVTEAEAEELISFAKDLRSDVLQWLKKNHRDLLK